MECEEIKRIIPRYFQHTATEEEIRQVEEHLCICHDCRATLGELMDKLTEEPQANKADDAEASKEPSVPSGGMEYFPGKDVKDLEKTITGEPLEKSASNEKSESDKQEISEPNLEPEKKPNQVLPKEPEISHQTNIVSQQQPLPKDEPVSSARQQKRDFSESASGLSFNGGASSQTDKEPLYSLDKVPLKQSKVGPLEYAALVIGFVVCTILIFLLIKG
ncbi:MAG: zf-HC2 domain-containing protein [Candidatus Omnitrophica bacterium]|nr:zf-HC2 domain-containing protein [Candidatus Omnitrophota bacterium]MDD5430595.1 zf-HC2 domain-containing protein [Candidatus Omnitrophota bacterium]